MNNWKKRTRPICLEKRYEFSSYEETRAFLDSLSSLSETEKIFPDISFGTTYVNITLRPDEEKGFSDVTDRDEAFASSIDKLLNNVT